MLKKVLLGIVIALVIAIIFLALASPHLLFHMLFGRPSRSTKIPSYYVDTPHYKVSRAGMAKMKELPNSDHYIQSRDGLKLHAYLFPANGEEHPKKFVIGVHGYRSYSRPECAPYIEFYHSLGYSMLMVDDRAHAPSEGDYIGFGVLDRLDVTDWAKYLVETYGDDVEILLHGVSMGGATVCAASGEPDLPEQVKGIVADCAFASADEIVRYQLKEAMHLPSDILTPKIEKLCEKKIGFNFHDYSALEQVQKAKVPMLFVQGGKDTMVPPFMVHELYDACASEQKKLLFVDEAGHGESIAFAPDEYHAAIQELFDIH